jgi:hypothetical protein
VSRVPLPLVILLCLAIPGGIWWHGTKDYDFLKPPSPTQIEFARMRAAGELAQPSDLFAVEPAIETEVVEIAPPAPPPEPPPPVPTIETGDLDSEPTLDAWTGGSEKPAASYINLASKLEADTQMTWALLAWERVLDHSSATIDEQQIALNGVRRLRATLPPWRDDPKDATAVNLIVEAPSDRLKLSMKAAQNAAEIIEKSSSGILKVKAVIRKSRETPASPKLNVMLVSGDAKDSPSVETPSPETAEEIEEAIIKSVFKLVGSKMALRDDLKPISMPQAGELPAQSLEYRITRLTWQQYADSLEAP